MEIFNWKKTLLPYEQAVNELKVKFESLSKEFTSTNQHSPIEQVVGRVKSLGSILEKANRKGIELSEIELYIEDIAGIRIICRFVEDIEKVAQLIRDRNGKDIIITKELDYIKNRKISGYRSYHFGFKYTVITVDGPKEILCEVQIRTMAMNFWAVIEHSLKYKYNDQIPKELKERLKILAEASFNLDKEMGTIRSEILEAQKVIQVKNDYVDKIIMKMQKLFHVTELEEMHQLDEEFVKINSTGNIEKLIEFNNKLNLRVHIYKLGSN